jgi:hypothetical protein
MEPRVEAELEQVERSALSAAGAPEERREEALLLVGSYASAALSTLLHLGLITREEDREWRERLAPVVGERIKVGRFRITASGPEPTERTAKDEATHAYAICRDLTLTQLAWSVHTAATEEVITEALAAEASDPDRIRRACRRGFADRGERIVSGRHDL